MHFLLCKRPPAAGCIVLQTPYRGFKPSPLDPTGGLSPRPTVCGVQKFLKLNYVTDKSMK